MSGQATTEPAKPLASKRVLDCATFIAGPSCATLLGEFGAEVMKIELPGVGCPLRQFGTMTETSMSLPWLSEARNKKSVTLDLRKPEGAAILKDLTRSSHVVVENFQPGTLESWGLGWDDLSAVNPALVMVRVSAYGQTGPYRDRPGFGRIANAFGGLSYLAGYPDRPPVTPGSATLPDYLSGLYGALGALLALRVAEQSGIGQVVDVGLYEGIFRILDELAPAYDYRRFVRERMGPGTVNAVPHSHYPTADGKWVAIACTSDKIFRRFAELMGRPELAGDGEWGTTAKRQSAREAVDAFVAEWTGAQAAEDVLRRCEEAQVPCGPLLSIADIFADPHYAARENLKRLPVAGLGAIMVPNVVPKLSATPGSVDSAGPPLGAHTDEILSQLLGFDTEQLQELRARKVI
jgi:crotonobetainyl-CoA:carnitine CoA-transferase CaiB-like acyl-CoA transferase